MKAIKAAVTTECNRALSPDEGPHHPFLSAGPGCSVLSGKAATLSCSRCIWSSMDRMLEHSPCYSEANAPVIPVWANQAEESLMRRLSSGQTRCEARIRAGIMPGFPKWFLQLFLSFWVMGRQWEFSVVGKL